MTLRALLLNASLSVAAPPPPQGQVDRSHRVGQAGNAREDESAHDNGRHSSLRADGRGGLLHDHAGRNHRDAGGKRHARIPSITPRGMDRDRQFRLLLGQRAGQPIRPPPGQAESGSECGLLGTVGHVGHEDDQRQEQAHPRPDQSSHDSEAHQRDPEPNPSLEEDRASMETDPTCDDSAQPEQGSQIEDVRAKRHPDPDRRVPARDGRHRGGDLRAIGGQRREQSEERLRQTEALAHPLETRYEQHAGDEADGCTEREDPHLHTPFWRPARLVRSGSYR